MTHFCQITNRRNPRPGSKVNKRNISTHVTVEHDSFFEKHVTASVLYVFLNVLQYSWIGFNRNRLIYNEF